MNEENLLRIDAASIGHKQRYRDHLDRFLNKVFGIRLTPAPLLFPPPPTDPPRTILVIKLWGIGEMVLAGRALASLRHGFPGAKICLASTEESSTVYQHNGLFDEVILFDPLNEGQVYARTEEFYTSLTDRAFDLAVNLDGLSRLSALITTRCGASVSAGIVSGTSPYRYHYSLPYDPSQPVSLLLYRLARLSGGTEEPEELLSPVLLSHEQDAVDAVIQHCGLDRHSLLIGFSICSDGIAPERTWPVEKFALLAQQLHQQEEFKTLFFGQSGEERYVVRCLKLMNTPGVNLAGQLTLRQFIAFQSRLHLSIACDSTPLLLAAAMNLPTIGIYGPETPSRVGPPDGDTHVAITAQLACSPCLSRTGMNKNFCVHGLRCMSDISVENVYSQTMDLLESLSEPDSPPWLEG